MALALRTVAEARGLEPRGDLLFGLRDGQAIEKARIDEHALTVEGGVRNGKRGGIGIGRANHRGRAEAISIGKIEIALIVCRAAEDRARAVIHQHEIGGINRQLPVGSKG